MYPTTPVYRVLLAITLLWATLTPGPRVARAATAPPAPMGLAFQDSDRGPGRAVAGIDHFLYVSQGGRLAVLDLNGTAGHQQVASLALDGEIADLAVSGSTLLAIVWPYAQPAFSVPPHIALLSLADPADPQPTGTLAGLTPVTWSADGGHVYVLSDDGKLTIVSPGATPGTPVVATYTLGVESRVFVAKGAYLYVMTGVPDAVVVHVYHLAPGTAPELVGDTTIGAANVNHAAPSLTAAVILGDLLLLTIASVGGNSWISVDIGDPAAPVAAIGGTKAAMAFPMGDRAALLTYADGGGPIVQQVEIWSTANPKHPARLTTLSVPATTGGQVVGDRLYIVGQQHISSVQLSAAQPTVERLAQYGGPADWDVSGGRLYTAEVSDDGQVPGAFTVVDLADQDRPAFVASFAEAGLRSLAVDEAHAVAATSWSWTLYDIGQVSPTALYTATSASVIERVALDGDRLALLLADATRVYDLASGTPTLIASVPVTGTELAMAGALVWVFDAGTGSARAVDLTTPSAPAVSPAVSFGPLTYVGDMAAIGDLLLLGHPGGQLAVLQRQSDGTVTTVANLNLTAWGGGHEFGIFSLDLKGSEVLVGLETHCIVVDVSVPSAPVPTWIAASPHRPCEARWNGADLVLGPYIQIDLKHGYDAYHVFPLTERTWLPSIKAFDP